MKYTPLIFVLCLSCFGSTVEVQYTEQFNSGTPNCGSFYACPDILVTVPQWDPAQGTLKEVDWSFEDTQFWHGGINDMYQPAGQPWSVTFTDGARSADIGMDATTSEAYSGLTSGRFQISMGGWDGLGVINASGALTSGLDLWVGTGTKTISIQPYMDVRLNQGFQYVFAAGTDKIQDWGSLSISYVDDPATVPEPRWTVLLLLIVFAAASVRNRVLAAAR